MIHELGENATKYPRRRKYLHWYIVGFVDAEGCFSVSVKKQEGMRFGYVLDPVFHVVQKDRIVLDTMKVVFNAGRVEKKHGQDEWQYVVDNRRQLIEKILPFFKKHKLVVKARDFQLFAEIVEGLEHKEHWTREGFIRLLKLAYKATKQPRKRSLEEVLSSLKGGSPQRPYARASSKKS